MTLATLDAITHAPELFIDWRGNYAANGPGATFGNNYAVPLGTAVWGNGFIALPFQNPGTAAGENPTSYLFGPKTIAALPSAGLITAVDGVIAAPGFVCIWDLLWHGFATGATAGVASTFTGQPSLPARDINASSNGDGLWFVAASNQQSNTISGTYTNSVGTAGRSSGSVSIAAARNGGLAIMPLAAGDAGVRKIESITPSINSDLWCGIARLVTRVNLRFAGANVNQAPNGEVPGQASPPFAKVFAGSVLFPTYGASSISPTPRLAAVKIAMDV